jgi:hypothetical protein
VSTLMFQSPLNSVTSWAPRHVSLLGWHFKCKLRISQLLSNRVKNKSLLYWKNWETPFYFTEEKSVA